MTAPGPVKVGVIGCGYWGPNLIRNFVRHDQATVTMVCDAAIERATQEAKYYGIRGVTHDPGEVVSSPDVDLVIVATPSATHYPLAKAAIQAGKHVLVMKPMTTRVDHAEELVELATRQGVLLAVDHTFVYTGAVQHMRQLVSEGTLGEVFYIDSVRINLGIFQSDVNVIWDLAAHDIGIIDFVLGGSMPSHVSAVGASHAGSWAHNIAYLTMRYEPNVLAHVHVNWLAPAKIRRTIVGGSRQMLVYDDMQPSEKLQVYDRGVSIAPWTEREEVYSQLVSYRSGDMRAPRLDDREALAVEADHLVDCILNGGTPMADGHAGLRTVRILDAADISAQANDLEVAIPRPASTSESRAIPVDAPAGEAPNPSLTSS